MNRFIVPLALFGLSLGGCREEAQAPQAPASESAMPTAPASAPPSPAMVVPVSPAASQAIPADVAAFVARRDQCDHFRGEEATDDERGHFLAEQLDKYCTGTDAVLARLRREHAAQPAAIAALKDYEDKIE
ncbi:MAG: hypothetical protein KGL44_08580 [Sphingomonadales bacterium]|nr:hypothetical protein [Sphingomonadales bacterium]